MTNPQNDVNSSDAHSLGSHSRDTSGSGRMAASGASSGGVSSGSGSARKASYVESFEDYTVRKRKKKSFGKRHRRAIIITVSIVAVAAAVAVAVAVGLNAGKKSITSHEDQNGAGVATSSVQTVNYAGHTYELNDKITSILFIGYDAGTYQPGKPGTQADAIIDLAIDTETGKMTAIEIPRDSMIAVDTYTTEGSFVSTQTMQACLAYGYAAKDSNPAQNVKTAVSRVLNNVPIDYYFAMDEDGIPALADAIGGVPLNALDTIPNTSIVAGEDQILMDYNAYAYVQYRDTTVLDSSLSRQARQVQFVKAFAQNTLSQATGNVQMFINLFNTAVQYSSTDLDATEFGALAQVIVENGISDIDITALTGTLSQGTTYAEYNLDTAATQQLVLDTYYTQVS